jgi:hypothetical protein
MAYGVELYSATGAVTLSISDRVGFFIARLTGVVNANSSVNVSVSGIAATSTKSIVNTNELVSVRPIEVSVGTNQVTITNGASVQQPYSILLVKVT